MHVAQVCLQSLCILSRGLSVDSWRRVLTQPVKSFLKQFLTKVMGNALKDKLWVLCRFFCYPLNVR
jgi:hypothetical protein